MTTDEGMDRGSLELFGQIVSANAANAAAMTNSLLETKDGQIRDLATMLLELEAILADYIVMDRKTTYRLEAFSHKFQIAVRMLESLDRQALDNERSR